MATLDALRKSITQMGRAEVIELLTAIRTNRRRRPEKSLRKQASTPAKVARAPKKSNLKQQDIFAYTQGLSDKAKNALATELLKGML